ncbi:MAG: prepilin-type N-terminal cleavage/methylation domain-containing protein [Syntrophotaleaceae bacterium]
MNNQKGFTLWELTIVILLIGIFASLTVPVLSHYGRDDLAWSARRIAGTVQFLFNEAAISGLEHRLSLEFAENRLGVMVVESDRQTVELETWKSRLALPEGVRIKDIRVAGRGSFSTGSATIRFFPGGYLEESIIHLSRETKDLTLRLNPFTGATDIREGYHEF